jgi:hypothetical protein
MELDQAATAARAAKDTELRHVVWSTLEDTRPHFAPTSIYVITLASADAEAASSSWITVQTVISTLIEIEGYDWPHEEATVQAGRAAGQCE